MIRPLHAQLLVKLHKEEESTKYGGLILAGKPPCRRGTVVAMGPDVKNIQVGETVLMRRNNSAVDVRLGSDEVLINETDALAVEYPEPERDTIPPPHPEELLEQLKANEGTVLT